MFGLMKRKPQTCLNTSQLSYIQSHSIFEVRGESEYGTTVVLVAAIDGEEACQLAKEASITLLSGKILEVQAFFGVSSIKKGLLSKYSWRKDIPGGMLNENLERKKL